MDYSNVINAAAAISGLSLVFGLGLGFAAIKFAVPVDERFPGVRALLPGANCGGCGFAGCDAFANAILDGHAKANGCPVNNNDNVKAIGELLGVEVTPLSKRVSFVRCNGTCENAKEKYEYYGITDCKSAANLQGSGSKGCSYGCLGLGSCEKVCMFGAIVMKDGISYIDEDKCTACGQCVEACPKALIELVPLEKHTRVKCQSKDKGKAVKENCNVGCIGCGLCVKACEYSAITLTNNLAKIDYDKCVLCGACVAKCPTKAIISKL